MKIPNFGKSWKRVFKADGIDMYKYYNLTEGSKTLKKKKPKNQIVEVILILM